jgi:hypothetical protein
VTLLDVGVVPVDKPQIVVKNSKDQIVMTFGLELAGQPGLTFWDKGDVRTKVGIGPEGHAILGLHGKGPTLRAAVAVAEDGTPMFEAYDKDMKSVWKAP